MPTGSDTVAATSELMDEFDFAPGDPRTPSVLDTPEPDDVSEFESDATPLDDEDDVPYDEEPDDVDELTFGDEADETPDDEWPEDPAADGDATADFNPDAFTLE